MYFLSEKVGFHCYVSLPKGSSPDIMSVKPSKTCKKKVGSERFGSSHGISTIKTSSGCRGAWQVLKGGVGGVSVDGGSPWG